jgi:hypothetical protein
VLLILPTRPAELMQRLSRTLSPLEWLALAPLAASELGAQDLALGAVVQLV